nr:hypothetical protein [Tanacetum cinerariifolium]
MRTRSSSNLVGESSPNPTSSHPKRCNRIHSKQPFILKESPVDTIADQRTMAELLRAPTECYAEAIVVPPILTEHFELKHSLIKMMTSDQFFGLEKDNPHDHICWFNKITSTIKYKDVPNSAIKLMLFPFSLAGAARRWLEKEPPHSQTYLCSKLANKCCDYRHDRYSQTISSNPPPASVKSVEEICVTCDGAHLYYQCLSADGNTFSEFWVNIQGYVLAVAVNYNQGNSGYRPLSVVNQIRPSGFAQPNVQNNQNRFSQPQGYNRGNNFNQDSPYQALIQQNQVVPLTSMSNQTNELKNMMVSFFQMNTASTSGLRPLPSNPIANPKGELKATTTRSGLVLNGPSIPMPSSFINSEEDERVEETLTDQDLTEYTIKKMLKALLSNKEKLLELVNTPLNENCLEVILKKLPEKLRDPEKFLIPYGFSELKCKALADLGASLNLMPLSRCLCSGGKFTFPTDFVIVDYESDPRVPLILGRPFLRTTRALINVYGEEMILRDSDERLTLNLRHDTSSYSNQPQKESINMINIYNDLCEDYLEELFATNHLSGNLTFSSHTDLTLPDIIDPLSGSTTSSSPNHLLEEFADELALITFTPGNDDISFDIESDLREIEYFLNHDPTKEMDSILEDSVDEEKLADSNNDLIDSIPEMFTDDHTLDYSTPPLYDDVDDDLVEHDDFLPSSEYDSFLFKDLFEVDALPSTNNEDKVFNPGILIHENLSEVIVHVTPDKNVKKISSSNASLILEDFNPPLSNHELPFNKEVPGFETLLSFSSEDEEKVFKPGILTSKGVHTSLLLELSHRGPKTFKVIKICESPMEIFLALMERISVF